MCTRPVKSSADTCRALHKAPPEVFCSRLLIPLHNGGEELVSFSLSSTRLRALQVYVGVYLTTLEWALETENERGGAEMLHDSFSFGNAVLNSAQRH